MVVFLFLGCVANFLKDSMSLIYLGTSYLHIPVTVARHRFLSAPGSRPNILQKTEVQVVSNEECNRWYHSQGTKVKVVDTQMCAGHEDGGRDSCWVSSYVDLH